jgi:hypothetical protein
VSFCATIWIEAAIGTAMIAPTTPNKAPKTITLAITTKPEASAALPNARRGSIEPAQLGF